MILVACSPVKQAYPVPEQHRPFFPAAMRSMEFVRAGDPREAQFYVRGIAPESTGDFRWTSADPELRFTLQSTRDAVFVFQFSVHERTFAQTGPVPISFYVNGHLLGREEYGSAGDKIFERRVPAEWLAIGQETRVRVEVHKPWRDGDAVLGVIFRSGGFLHP